MQPSTLWSICSVNNAFGGPGYQLRYGSKFVFTTNWATYVSASFTPNSAAYTWSLTHCGSGCLSAVNAANYLGGNLFINMGYLDVGATVATFAVSPDPWPLPSLPT